MTTDPRCCGSGACIVDPEGRCWCGQVWDGQKMAHPPLTLPSAPAPVDAAADSAPRCAMPVATPEADCSAAKGR